MGWFPYLFILLGLFLLILIPFLVQQIRTDPTSLLRPQWQNTTSPGFAKVIGVLIILMALIGGLYIIILGFFILL